MLSSTPGSATPMIQSIAGVDLILPTFHRTPHPRYSWTGRDAWLTRTDYLDLAQPASSTTTSPHTRRRVTLKRFKDIPKHQIVIQDSWGFYRAICNLLNSRREYEDIFKRLQQDPVYPYFQSLTGLNDRPSSTEYENRDKTLRQEYFRKYNKMTLADVAQALILKAQVALPRLVQVCKELASIFPVCVVGIGPIKKRQAALTKAQQKYKGDLLKVTDYCRSLLVVQDLPTLLALLEVVRDRYSDIVRRVKLSSLQHLANAKVGGYRDCILNLELAGHICEIQVHLLPMWKVGGVEGFQHYRHSLEYSADSFKYPYDALRGLDWKTLAEMLIMAEAAVAKEPNLAESTLKQLIELRCESPDIGPHHAETMTLYKYLEWALKTQGKKKEARRVARKWNESMRKARRKESYDEEGCGCLAAFAEAFEMIMDPLKEERIEEERSQNLVRASKKKWKVIRSKRFSFLDKKSINRQRQRNLWELSMSSKLEYLSNIARQRPRPGDLETYAEDIRASQLNAETTVIICGDNSETNVGASAASDNYPVIGPNYTNVMEISNAADDNPRWNEIYAATKVLVYEGDEEPARDLRPFYTYSFGSRCADRPDGSRWDELYAATNVMVCDSNEEPAKVPRPIYTDTFETHSSDQDDDSRSDELYAATNALDCKGNEAPTHAPIPNTYSLGTRGVDPADDSRREQLYAATNVVVYGDNSAVQEERCQTTEPNLFFYTENSVAENRPSIASTVCSGKESEIEVNLMPAKTTKEIQEPFLPSSMVIRINSSKADDDVSDLHIPAELRGMRSKLSGRKWNLGTRKGKKKASGRFGRE